MKTLIRIVIAIVVLLFIGVVALLLSMGRIIKSTVESQGAAQLKVTTTLDDVSLGLFTGTFGLKHFALGSPQGFTAPEMLSLASMSVDTGGLLRLRDEPIHISSITIDGTKLVIEQNGQKTNIKELINNLPKSTRTATPEPKQPQPTTTTKPIRLIIDKITLSNGDVALQASIVGISKMIDVPIPSFTFTDIGNEDGKMQGAEVKDVVVQIITQMVAQATKTGKLPANISGLLGGNFSSITDQLNGLAKKKGLGSLLDQVTGNGNK